MFKYITGGYHPAPDMELASTAQVWGIIRYLDTMKRLVDIVCISDAGRDGIILTAPYDESMIVGIFEEKVEGSDQPRRWILQS